MNLRDERRKLREKEGIRLSHRWFGGIQNVSINEIDLRKSLYLQHNYGKRHIENNTGFGVFGKLSAGEDARQHESIQTFMVGGSLSSSPDRTYNHG